MHPSRSVAIERTLAALARRLEQLHGELSEQAEDIAARLECGKSASARSLARYERKGERFWSLKCRYEQLRGRHPAPPVAADDF